VNPAFSDSANLDATLELLVRSGRPITESLLTLVPEAFRDQPELADKPDIQSFYEYSACTQEPWDGPALLVFADGAAWEPPWIATACAPPATALPATVSW
jgi:Glutamate synthase domain 1